MVRWRAGRAGPDLISRFLEAASNQKARKNPNEAVDDELVPVGDDELVDIVINFIIAGARQASQSGRPLWPMYRRARSFDPQPVLVVHACALAGRDTTAAALTWTMHELLQNAECIDRSRAEINSKVPLCLS